ncbi:hypothetical protein HK097_001229 [Rhizophlyctis rosea]|uniref:Uncharacterized protein n=1 Tax=Rhizophlyctis rosea TaxID=64517 RepID=A0AAD5WYG0_9FUNG|nr:hypothetical protein HK097_001229 [Rhizophlyctis rosea]
MFAAKHFLSYDSEPIAPVLLHVRELLCTGVPEHYEYMENWLAHKVQKPNMKTKTSLVTMGMQETGKEGFSKEFFGMMVIDEISDAKEHKNNNKLKSTITRDRQKVEKKGKDAYQIDYFVDFEKDLSAFNPAESPTTKEKEDMKVQAMSPLQLFVRTLKGGKIHLPTSEGKGKIEPNRTYEAIMDWLWVEYKSHCTEAKVWNRESKQCFCILIREMVDIGNKSSNRGQGTPVYFTMSAKTGDSRT